MPEALSHLTEHCVQEHPVTTKSEAMSLVQTGLRYLPQSIFIKQLYHACGRCRAKTTSANYKHDASSRSHTIFRLQIESAEVTTSSSRVLENLSSASLMLVDLAGSEAALKNVTVCSAAL